MTNPGLRARQLQPTGSRHFMKRATTFEIEAMPHLDAVFRFAFRLTGSSADAEDLVQETYLRAYRSWHRYEPGTRAKSWLFTICRNAFLRQRQHDSRRDEIMLKAVNDHGSLDLGTETALFMAPHQQDPEGSFFFSVIDGEVLAMIDRLPAEFREVVLLSDLEGIPYAEIAQQLDVPIGTVKSRLFRGRRLLQERLYLYATESGYVRSARERLTLVSTA
ncbi:MAG TPA: sigma-70 family RNA polymerase sigma factor [Pseudolabrys sp.]|nr:sigma-70 family RNA polymerase sigma factor [Pseudolabrys sp.]